MVTKKKERKVYLDLEDDEELEQIADAEQRPVGGLIRIAVKEYLARRRAQST